MTDNPSSAAAAKKAGPMPLLGALAIIGIVIAIFVGPALYHQRVEEQYQREDRDARAKFAVTIDRLASNEVPRAFAAWHASTYEAGDVLDWNGSTSTVLLIERDVDGNLVRFIVWAQSPARRYFTVTYQMNSAGVLRDKAEFRQKSTDDVVNVLSQNGQSALIDKLGLQRRPA